jgi:hypothetical protein
MSQMYQDTGDKDTAIPLFREEAVENKSESKLQGRPVFEKVPYVLIIVPGSKDVVDRPVEEKDKERWPRQWQQFQSKEKQTQDGTPIDELSTATAVERATCKALNVQTIEGLVNFPDSSIHRLGPGGHGLKRKAQAFLGSRDSAQYATALQEEVRNLRTQVAELKLKLSKDSNGERAQESSG